MSLSYNLPTGDAGIGGAPTPGAAPQTASILPDWLHTFLQWVTGGGHAIDAVPPVSVDMSHPTVGGMTRVPSAIGTDKPYDASPSGGGLSLPGLSGVGEGLDSIAASITGVQHATERGSVYLLVALLFLLGAAMWLAHSDTGQAVSKGRLPV